MGGGSLNRRQMIVGVTSIVNLKTRHKFEWLSLALVKFIGVINTAQLFIWGIDTEFEVTKD